MLAGIALMVSILWATLANWQADAADQQERMRLHRVTELLREQWADRRTTTPMEEGGREYTVTDRSIAFVTAMPILFPEWPLVAVSYTIERSDNTIGGTRTALVYEERRLLDVTEPPPTNPRDEQGRPLIRRMVLIDGAQDLAWQRFGRLTERQQEQAAAGRSTAPAEQAEELSPTEQREADRAARRAGTAVRSRDSNIYGFQSPLAELDLHRPDRRTDLDDPELNRWRPIEPEFVGRLSAVRLVGLAPAVLPPPRTLRTDEPFDEQWLPPATQTQEQELFACVLIVMGSP